MLHTLGHYRVVSVTVLVGFSLCGFAFADFGSSDSENLANLTTYAYNFNSTLGTFLTKYNSEGENRRLSYIADIDTYTLLTAWNKKIFGSATYSTPLGVTFQRLADSLTNNVPLLASSVVRPGQSVQNQIAVTNVAETAILKQFMETNSALLSKIHHDLIYGGGDGYTVYSPYIYSRQNVSTYELAIDQLMQGISQWDQGTIDDATFLNRYGGWLENIHDFASHIDYHLLPTSLRSAYLDVLTRFAPYLRGATVQQRFRDSYAGISSLYQSQYGTYLLTSNALVQSAYTINNGGLSANVFTNLFTSDGSAAVEKDGKTYSSTNGIFGNFAKSFLPSGLFSPEKVNTNLFEYVDSDLIDTPTFNPQPLRVGTRSSSRSSLRFNYDFDDSNDYSYNLVNPVKTATDVVQGDTDTDNNFQMLADLVNQRLSSMFDSSLNEISQQPSRWSVKFRDKDGASVEMYVASQQAKTTDGISFVCWVLESTMFAGFFFVCVRRSLRIGNGGDASS